MPDGQLPYGYVIGPGMGTLDVYGNAGWSAALRVCDRTWHGSARCAWVMPDGQPPHGLVIGPGMVSPKNRATLAMSASAMWIDRTPVYEWLNT